MSFSERLGSVIAARFKVFVAALLVAAAALFVLSQSPLVARASTEPSMSVLGYSLDEETQRFIVEGASSLPEGALVAVESYPLDGQLYPEGGVSKQRFFVRVQPDGLFFANVDAAPEQTPVVVRFAFSPGWQDDDAAKRVGVPAGASTVGEGDERQLYTEKVLFPSLFFEGVPR